jgi:hypothetical protein
MLWFHGDAARREHFEDQKWDRDPHEDRNASGPGIYFTEDIQQARSYASGGGHVYAAKLRPTFKVLPNKPPTLRFLKKFYDAASPEDQYYFLSNWMEEPDIRNPAPVLRKYLQYNDRMIDALLVLRNDLVQDPSDWIKAARATGYHGHIVQLPEVRHLVVWDPRHLVIREVT